MRTPLPSVVDLRTTREVETPLIFLDCETTGLDPVLDDMWEFCAIRRDPGVGYERRLHVFLEHNTDRAQFLPEKFRRDHDARYDPAVAFPRREAAAMIAGFLACPPTPPHLVGLNPSFDVWQITTLLTEHGQPLNLWNYHLLDLNPMMVQKLTDLGQRPVFPWRSDALAEALGVLPAEDRHTAVGDVEWQMRIWDALIPSGHPVHA